MKFNCFFSSTQLKRQEKRRFQGHYPILIFFEPSFLWSAGKELPNAQKRYQYLQAKGWKMGGADSLRALFPSEKIPLRLWKDLSGDKTENGAGTAAVKDTN